MSVCTAKRYCKKNTSYLCDKEHDDCKFKAHKPEPNESVSPSRTRGSLPAAPGQSEVEAAAVQLAPILCPRPQDSKSLPQCGADLDAFVMNTMLYKATTHEERLRVLTAIRDMAYSTGYRHGYKDAKDGE